MNRDTWNAERNEEGSCATATSVHGQTEVSSKRPEVSVVIVTWNGKELADKCLKSVLQEAETLRLEAIVVDNASTDGTAELIEESYPSVELVRNSENLGFAKANNTGITKCKGRYTCLINSDVIVPPGCLRTMLEFMDEQPTIGVLGPMMVGPDGNIGQSVMRFPGVLNSFGRALALDTLFKGSKWFGGQLMTDFGYDNVQDVDVLTGWFWMTRREALMKVGGLDERFFMYGEDIDWCKRFWQAGYRVVYFPGARAIHYGGASSSRSPIRFHLEMLRARSQYVRKHHGRVSRLGFAAAAWLHSAIRLVGYGALYVVSPCRRPESRFKIQRSVACLRWLMGLQVDAQAR